MDVERAEKAGKKTETGERQGTCPSDVLIKRSLETTERLEEDARKVRGSASICSTASRGQLRLAQALTTQDRL